MNYLSTGIDPECDKPTGVFWGDDLGEADLRRISGLSLSKGTIGLSRVSGSKRIKYVCTTYWSTEIAEFVRSLPCLSQLHISRVRGTIVQTGKIPTLKVLTLFACSGLQSLQPFAKCAELESLWISGCVRFKTLEGLSRYKKLSELEILGSMTKSGTIESLTPLSRCALLTHVGLATRTADDDLSFLHKLKRLSYLRLQNRFKRGQYEAILASCPRLATIELHNGSFDRVLGFQEDKV
jgi:hypothetical protein